MEINKQGVEKAVTCARSSVGRVAHAGTVTVRSVFLARGGIFLRFFDAVRFEFKWLRTELLKARLRECGANCLFNFPLRIEGPEFVSIGDRTSIAPYVHIWGQGGVEIGEDCLIGSHAAITSITHNKHSPIYNMENVRLPVKIGRNVWIGSHCIILPGVSVGDGAVIGAGAVVTHDVEASATVVGIPARSI